VDIEGELFYCHEVTPPQKEILRFLFVGFIPAPAFTFLTSPKTD
jgi:hypothetical protein